MATQPVHTIRLGLIKASVWKNETPSGAVRHNVTIVRLYKDDDEWKQTTTFGREDLPLVVKVADQAHTWIFESSSKDAEGR